MKKSVRQYLLRPPLWTLKALLPLGLIVLIVFEIGGYYNPLKQWLDSDLLAFTIGGVRLSLYTIFKGILAFLILFWLSLIAIGFFDKKIQHHKKLQSQHKVFLEKLTRGLIYTLCGLLFLQILGIKLASLAILGGAVGIGIGFGLQKIASNFISGIILMFEQSLKIEDLIELQDGTTGFVRKIRSRYILLETFDGREIMIPNEEFINHRVLNWTFSHSRGRIQVDVGIAYNSNIEKAKEILLEAASPHSLKDPPPMCYLRRFNDSSIDLSLFFWIKDVAKGRFQPKSEVMMEIWKKFQEHHIEIPYPQRDLHLKTLAPLAQKGEHQKEKRAEEDSNPRLPSS